MAGCTLVIATVVGREHALERALESARWQTLPFDAVEVELDAGRAGPAAARNKALRRVGTDLAAVMDDDDVLLPMHLERLAGALERAGEGTVLAHPACMVQGGDVPEAWQQRWALPFAASARALMRQNWIPVTTVFRTEAVLAVGGYPEGGPEDWAMLKALVRRYGPRAIIGPGDPGGPGPDPTWVYMRDVPSEMAGGRYRP